MTPFIIRYICSNITYMAKARRELASGIKNLEDTWTKKIDKHMNVIEKKNERKGASVLLAVVPHILCLFFTVVVVWMARPGSSFYSWHPTMMSLAFMFFMSEGVLSFSAWFSLYPSAARDIKTRWHWVLLVLTMVSAYSGLAAITYNKIINNKHHYVSWHGFSGIIVCGTLALQASGGLVQMYPSILPFAIRRVILKRLHAFSGTVTFSGAMLTLVLGLYTKWFSGNVASPYLWWACCACPVVMFSAVFFQFVKNHVVQMFTRY